MRRVEFLIVGSLLLAAPAAAQWVSGTIGADAHSARAAATSGHLTVNSSADESPGSVSFASAIEDDREERDDDAEAAARSRSGRLIERDDIKVTVPNDSRRARVVGEQTCRINR